MLLLLVQGLHTMDRHILVALLELIRHEFMLTDGQLGILSGTAFSLASLIAGVPLGMLADRFSRKTILTSALALWSGLTALCGAATGFTLLLAARAGVGASESAGPPCALAMIADAVPEERQGSAIGLFYACGAVGAFVALSLGGWIAAQFGWRMAFFMTFVPAAALLPVLFFQLAEPPRTKRAGRDEVSFAKALGDIVADRHLALLIVAMITASFAPVSLLNWSTSLMVRNHGVSLSAAGFIAAVVIGLLVPLGQLFGGQLGDRLAARRMSNQMQIITPEKAIAYIREIMNRVTVEHFMMFVPPGFSLEKFSEYA